MRRVGCAIIVILALVCAGVAFNFVRGWTEAHGGTFSIGNDCDGTVLARLRLPGRSCSVRRWSNF